MDYAVERPWAKSYTPGVPVDLEIPNESVTDMFDKAAGRFASRVALDFFGREWTYTQFHEDVERGAQVLHDHGVRHGDRVALVLPNCPQHVIAFQAVLRLGAIVVEHNPLYTADELERQFSDHRAQLTIAWDMVIPTIDHFRDTTGIDTVLSVNLTRTLPRLKQLGLRLPIAKVRRARESMTGGARGDGSFDELMLSTAPIDPGYPRPVPTDIAALQYTGGTTGTPKGAILTHANLRANAAQCCAWVPGVEEEHHTIYAVLPMFHAFGLMLNMCVALQLGATVVLFPKFDVDMILDAQRRRPVTFFPGVPAMYETVARKARERKVDISTVQLAFSGATTMPESIQLLWEETTKGQLCEGYGMTEASPIALNNPVGARRIGTVGLPFPSTDVRIVDPENANRQLPLGQQGELLIRGPQVMSGYWHRPEETTHSLMPGGWLRTGDVAVMDEDGYVRIVDRIKELIITGGFNVYPSEVEEVLRTLPGVTDAACVGMPSTHSGETVVAAITVEPGLSIDTEAMRTELRSHLTAYKVPRQIIVVEDLPRSLIGKILRRQVRDELKERMP